MLRPCGGNESEKFKEETDDFIGSSLTEYLDGNPSEPINIPSSPESLSCEDTEHGDDQLTGNPSNQLVLYNPETNGAKETESIQSGHPSNSRFSPYSKVLPSIGAFTVQCAKCFKWRFIPTKQKYEEIREHILQKPFFCEIAREWRSDISCDDPTDITQDGSRLWAIDKPNIAQPPLGWQRLLHIRGEGSTKFADVYYQAPSGKKLRSMVEVQKYLMDHPEYMRDGVSLSQFSFQIPRPLQENYVRKRPARVMASRDNTRTPEPAEATPLSWVVPEPKEPEDLTELHLGKPGPSPSHSAEASFDPPTKKPRQQSESQNMNHHSTGDPIHEPSTIETDELGKPKTASDSGH